MIVRHLHDRQAAPVAFSNRSSRLNKALVSLRSDPNVADIVYSAARDQWDVTPSTITAEPKSFGRYVCFALAQADVAGTHTTVRVIDGDKLQSNDFDYAAASRGTFGCNEERP